MFLRAPHQGPLANSSSRIALLFRSGNGAKVVEVGNGTVVAVLLVAALLFAWYLVATVYLVFRDDVIVSLLSGRRHADFVYEERIAELRSRIDRITARQIVNQDSVEDRVAVLVARQAELEARHMMVSEITQRAEKAGIALPNEPVPTTATLPARNANPAGTALGGPALPVARPRPMPLDAAGPDAGAPRPFAPINMRGPVDKVLGVLIERSGKVEEQQLAALSQVALIGQGQASKSRIAIATLGLDPTRFAKALSAPATSPAALRVTAPLDSLQLRDVTPKAADPSANDSAMGGPLLPPETSRQTLERFERHVIEAEAALKSAEGAKRVLSALPVGRPLAEQHDMTSGFGTRVDPFTRGYAQHSGLDFRAPTGTPVRASASGTVTDAGTNGGYGRMVEIDHGFGLTTRYAHLSAIHVKEGDRIEKGAVIGQVGSTGRSTGPHLHYEVRIDDDAADPIRFVRAGKTLRAN